MLAHRLIIVSGLTAALVLLACSQQENQEAGGMTEEVAPAADLDAVNASGVTGNVRLTPSDGRIEVELSVDGATEGQRYAAHIHRGDCGNDLGVAAALGEITVTGGEARLTTTVDGAALSPADHHFVQVHGADMAPVACGNLTGIGFGIETPSPGGAKTAEQGETY